jgi:prepilin-type N-terminal cleavage/methylation domain-containing protein
LRCAQKGPEVRQRGFTLIEVVLVLVILLVIAAVAALNLSSFASIKVNGAARRLASDIRFAQQLAMSQQVRHGVVFNIPVANQYTVYEQDDPTNPARNPSGGGNFVMSFTAGEYQGVTIASTLPADGFGRRLVKFDSQGQPLGGTSAALVAGTNTVTLTYQGVNAVVTVAPATGRVTY